MSTKKKPHFAVVAPIFPVTNIKESVNYYTEKLMFEIGFEWSDSEEEPVRYAILTKNDTELHLTQSETPRKAAAYFFLEDVKGYYNLIKEAANITHHLEDQPWGMREFEAADPDDNMLIFGEHIERITSS